MDQGCAAVNIKGVPISILALEDDSVPGLVECELVDAAGQGHRIIEKVPVITRRDVGPESAFPIPEVLACEVLSVRMADDGRSLSRIDTSRPWGVESSAGVSVFEVLSAVLVEVEPYRPDQYPVAASPLQPS